MALASISLKEASWLLARGRVRLAAGATPWAAWLREAAAAPGLEILPLTVEVAIESERFPDSFSNDPADRMIAATARVHDLTLVTADKKLRYSSHVRTIW